MIVLVYFGSKGRGILYSLFYICKLYRVNNIIYAFSLKHSRRVYIIKKFMREVCCINFLYIFRAATGSEVHIYDAVF